MRTLILAVGAMMVLAGCAGRTDYVFQPPAAEEPEAQIRFVQHGNVYSWHGVSDRLLYVQARDRQWYRVDLFAPCIGLEFALRIRVLPSDGAGTFDRFGHIAMRGQRCKVESVKKVAAPVRTPRSTAANDSARS